MKSLALAAIGALALSLAAPAAAQQAYPQQSYPQQPQTFQQQQQQSDGFTADEILQTGHNFFGSASRGLAELLERAFAAYGQPNGYVLGEEAGGALLAGLRYGEGVLHTRDTGSSKVFWQGPSFGYDFGANGARTMVLVYNLPGPAALYDRYVGVDGSAYVVGGLGMTVLARGNTLIVPIRTGVGLRLGANIGYLKFSQAATWNPF